MAMAFRNNSPIFYWTNGNKLFAEEYHPKQGVYYHNAYPNLSQFIAVCINASTYQPIPIPVNPPSNVQALLSAFKAKVSWRAPHLLGNQGKGTWQNWKYVLEVKNEDDSVTVHENITSTNESIDLEFPNTYYTFRVAAYTHAGIGPWSTEFRAKTLNSLQERFLVWSSSTGVHESDVIGEHVDTLITSAELDENVVSDIAWFENLIYLVSNNSLKIYNRTSRELSSLGDLDSVESVAIDWIGRRLYWSNPSKQLIIRSDLGGDQQQKLTIAVARELRIDSLNGFIYYSSGHAVEACRLNGKKKKTYFSVEPYSGLQVMGLTLDMDNEHIYWIGRKFDSSSLYRSNMIQHFDKGEPWKEIRMQEASLRGPLTHFSDRLLWLQDNHTVVVGDMSGRNMAQINNSKLNGIRTISVIDPAHHVYPRNLSNIVVIPHKVWDESIQIYGTWTSFNITWNRVQNVNFGQVFYELGIRVEGIDKPLGKEVDQPFIYINNRNHTIHPYTPIDITVQSFTYWGSSIPTRVRLFSPSSRPSAPTKVRVFIKHTRDYIPGTYNVSGTVRWNPPAKKNGPILGFKVKYCHQSQQNLFDCKNSTTSQNELSRDILGLLPNETYVFQVLATTDAGEGDFSKAILIDTKHEKPIPEVLAANQEQILHVDLDMNMTRNVVSTGSEVTHMVHIARERRVFWTNDVQEIWSSQGGKSQVKLATLTAPPLALSIDWIERVLYTSVWSGNGSTILKLNLNKFEETKDGPEVIFETNKVIKKVFAAPLENVLLWSEHETVGDKSGEVIVYDLNSGYKETFTHSLSLHCNNLSSLTKFQLIALDTVSPHETHLIWEDKNRVFSTGIISRKCRELGHNYQGIEQNFVKDSVRLYWTSNDHINSKYDFHPKNYSIQVPNIKALLSFYHQNYPPKHCLIPLQRPKEPYTASLDHQTENSVTLILPNPEISGVCEPHIPTTKYHIFYRSDIREVGGLELTCHHKNCTHITSFENRVRISNLKPYTKYFVQIGITSFYADKDNRTIILGPPFRVLTASGAPSPPQDVHGEVLSPTDVKISWTRPREMNSEKVYYEVHWQTENVNNGVQDRSHQVVVSKRVSNGTAFTIQDLQPEQKYNIWVRAHSTNTAFSQTDVIRIETFPDPYHIQVENSTSTSLLVSWVPQDIIVK